MFIDGGKEGKERKVKSCAVLLLIVRITYICCRISFPWKLGFNLVSIWIGFGQHNFYKEQEEFVLAILFSLEQIVLDVLAFIAIKKWKQTMILLLRNWSAVLNI